MANASSNKLKYLILLKTVDFDNDVFKVALMQSGYVFDPDTHDDYADISASELATGNGYIAGGATIATTTVTRDDVNNRGNVAFSNVTWTASVGPIGPVCGAIIYDSTVADSPIIGFIDFGADYTQADGGTVTLSNLSVRLS